MEKTAGKNRSEIARYFARVNSYIKDKKIGKRAPARRKTAFFS
jgi:hypothetical protein